MRIFNYDRNNAVEYARLWAYSRNPKYYDFSSIGGDCTNYASQCLFAGCGIQNYTKIYGWNYISTSNRTPSWTGVEYFYNFLTQNYTNNTLLTSYYGPFAKEEEVSNLEIGDFVQLGYETGDYYHTPIIVGFNNNIPLLAAHSFDAFNRPLNTYSYARIRGIKILGYRKE